MKEKYIVSIVGATGIGKTSLSIELAKYFKTEIISSDSRQFYKEMNIGTAVPSDEELNSAPHHFIQNRSIFEEYNVGMFEQDGLRLASELFLKKDLLIMVGGSGLYVDAVLHGLDNFPAVDPKIRKELILRAEAEGLETLQHQLKELDPGSFQRIDIQNKQRLIRALEICLGTGKPYSDYLQGAKKERDFQYLKIGIQADRNTIYDRINKRVDQMIDMGLVEEAKSLHPHRDLNALQTVGYRELFEYFDGNCSLEHAIEEIKKNTRRFAKRQGTWFRRDPEIKWFDYPVDKKEVTAYIHQKID